jgi:hypothetical protein
MEIPAETARLRGYRGGDALMQGEIRRSPVDHTAIPGCNRQVVVWRSRRS